MSDSPTLTSGTPGKSALILGATGAVGRHLLRELISTPHFTRVGEFGRRVTALDSPYVPQIPEVKQKLKQGVVDFEKLSEESEGKELKEGAWDVVFITMGTTRKAAGSFEMFDKIDREYVVNAAKAARTSSPTQRLVYLSTGASSATSPFPYLRSKGLTEQELVSIGYPDTIIFRPGALAGADRGGEPRLPEKIAVYTTNFLSLFTNSVQIQVSALGKAMRIAGQFGTAGLPASAQASKETFEGRPFTGVGNIGALGLAKEES